MCLFVILNYLWLLNMHSYLIFMYCIVGMCEVSPKMEKQGSFLFLVFGVTCSSTCTVLSNPFLFITLLVTFLKYKVFSITLTIVFLLIAYSTYLNYKVIIHNIRYKKLLSWGLLSFRLITFRWSFWSIDLL